MQLPGWCRLGMVLFPAILLLPTQAPVFGQSFLEKLEQAVRSQLAENPQADKSSQSPGSVEELPAPDSSSSSSSATRGRDVVPPVPNPRSPAAPPTASNVPLSILELAPSAVGQIAARSSGQIYLGLEAEEPVGGGIGVRVSSLVNQSPAWKAGFKVGDRILAINGYAIANLDDMVEQLARTSPGESARFLISRGQRNIPLTAVLMDAQLAGAIGDTGERQAVAEGRAFLGVMVNDLTDSFRKQFGIGVYRGAAVSEVSRGSPANQAGIQAGDAIVEASGVPIESADDLNDWMNQTRPGQQVELRIYRGTYARTVPVVLAAATGPSSSSASTFPELELSLDNGAELVSPNPLKNATSADASAKRDQERSVVESANDLSRFVVPPPRPSEMEEEPDSDVADLLNTVEQLKQENATLARQLAESQQRLEQTEAKLNRILELLKSTN